MPWWILNCLLYSWYENSTILSNSKKIENINGQSRDSRVKDPLRPEDPLSLFLYDPSYTYVYGLLEVEEGYELMAIKDDLWWVLLGKIRTFTAAPKRIKWEINSACTLRKYNWWRLFFSSMWRNFPTFSSSWLIFSSHRALPYSVIRHIPRNPLKLF